MSGERHPFHLAFPVVDLESTRGFYGGVLGLVEGRSTALWVDYDFCGHQISAHVKPEMCGTGAANAVDGDQVPVRHFGIVLEWAEWEALVERLRGRGVRFLIEPRVRFAGQVGEQATFFVRDPSGNALEFKSFRDLRGMFRRGAESDQRRGAESDQRRAAERDQRRAAERDQK